MIQLESTDEGFNIYYREYKLFSHTKKNPCFEMGIGIGKFKQSHSSFNIQEKLKERISLRDFKILSQLDNQIIIEFNHNQYSIVIEFYIQENRLIISPKCEDRTINRFWMKLESDQDEAIFGCGEQFSELNLKGKMIPIWVEDASPPTRANHTYYPQPNFISSHNYYCHVDTTAYSEFNFTKDNKHELYIWSVPTQIYFEKCETILDTVKKLNKYLGMQPKPPEWIYDGIWLGVQGGPEIVDKKIETALSHDIKVGGVWCQDWEGIRYTSFGKQLFWDWKYDEKIYPNLPEYIKKLNSKGIKFMGYINTMLAIEGDLYKEASKRGYCIKNDKGEDYLVMMTDFPAAQLDFSNPDAVDWIKSIIKKNMIGIGMNGWMVDYGEYVPVDAVLNSGVSGEEFHNLSPTLWNKLNFEAVKEENLLDKVMFFTRSGFTHSSKYTMMHFSGDQRVDWDKKLGLPSVIPSSINMGLCGIGYYHFDIGCYTTYRNFTRSKELFMRSAEIATFSTFMRTHEGNRPDVNWQFDSDEETLNHLSKMARIHFNLTPYLKHLSNEYQEYGVPPMRGCFMHYESDQELYNLKYQFMLGQDLLVAPVIKPGIDKWNLYLPDDDWIHLWSEKEYKHGWIEVEAPLGQPPVFYRKESVFKKLFSELADFKE